MNIHISARYRLVILLLTLCIFVLAGCTKKEDTIRIGAILPMTGDAAKYGKFINQGMSMAAEEINANGGIKGKKLAVIVQDSKTNPNEGVNAARFLISTEHPLAIMTTLTGVCKAVMPITEKEKIILFANATIPGITEHGNYVFRNVSNLANDVQASVDFCATNLKKKNVGIIWRNDDFGLWGSKNFEKQYAEKGGKVVASVSYDPKTENFRTQILKLAEKKPEIVYLLTYSESGKIIKQAKELGYNWQFMGITTLGDPEVAKIAGDALNGAIYTESVFNQNDTSTKMEAFQRKYKEKYGDKSEMWGATFYDAVKMFALAATNSQKLDTESIKESLKRIKNYDGLSGTTSFLPNGDVIKPVNLKVIKNQKPEILK